MKNQCSDSEWLDCWANFLSGYIFGECKYCVLGFCPSTGLFSPVTRAVSGCRRSRFEHTQQDQTSDDYQFSIPPEYVIQSMEINEESLNEILPSPQRDSPQRGNRTARRERSRIFSRRDSNLQTYSQNGSTLPKVLGKPHLEVAHEEATLNPEIGHPGFILNPQNTGLATINNPSPSSLSIRIVNDSSEDSDPPKQRATNRKLPPIPTRQLLCPICLAEKNEEEFTQITTCAHVACRECVTSFLTESINNDHADIGCFAGKDCPSKLNERSKTFESLPHHTRYRYYRRKNDRMVLGDPNLTFCPRVDCETILRKEKGTPLRCPICETDYCCECLETFHNGPCDQSLAKKVLRDYKYRKCPSCPLIVEKINGCRHITCICKNQFCYDCGVMWTSRHSCKEAIADPTSPPTLPPDIPPQIPLVNQRLETIYRRQPGNIPRPRGEPVAVQVCCCLSDNWCQNPPFKRVLLILLLVLVSPFLLLLGVLYLSLAHLCYAVVLSVTWHADHFKEWDWMRRILFFVGVGFYFFPLGIYLMVREECSEQTVIRWPGKLHKRCSERFYPRYRS